mmetsp:Transcript_17941/g.28503  ORF Transcript_17941/g.28503 Transcript_17941/m.28503 type:complete len:98 (+) Transcript_17941:344-637(+)
MFTQHRSDIFGMDTVELNLGCWGAHIHMGKYQRSPVLAKCMKVFFNTQSTMLPNGFLSQHPQEGSSDVGVQKPDMASTCHDTCRLTIRTLPTPKSKS